MTTRVLRTSPKFVTWFSIIYFGIAFITFIFLWFKYLNWTTIPMNWIGFTADLNFVVVSSLLWPGYFLSLLA